jgi:ACS family tartrate transporter-like MFS transporter
LWLLPGGPESASWLTDSERGLLTQVSANRTHERLIETLSLLGDRRVLLFGGANFCVMGATYAAALSAPLVLRDATAWTPARIGVVVALCNLVGAVAMLLNGWSSDRRHERYLHTIVPLAAQPAGYLGMALAHSAFLMVCSYAIGTVAGIAAQAAFWLTPSDEFKDRLADVGIAAIGSIGMIGAFIGPNAFGAVRDYTGDYKAGLLIVVTMFAVGTAVLACSWRLDRAAARQAQLLVEQAAIT